MEKKYVVHRACNAPGKESYAGAYWADLKMKGIRYEPQYSDYKYARHVAKTLSEINPVGYKVSEIVNETC